MSELLAPVRIPLARPTLPPLDAYVGLLDGIWGSRVLSNDGPLTRRFEQACASYGGWSHAVATSSCDLALTLAIAALGLPHGASVLLPSLTFGSTLHAALWNGLVPRFVDVEARSFALDPQALAAELDESAALILATHPFGATCDVDALEQLASDADVPLLFDAAHAFGTFVDGQHVGTRGTASGFSFSGTKLVTTGEGGVVASADADFVDRLRRLRAYGRNAASEETVAIGLNAKLSELHAALGLLTVQHVEREVSVRAALVDRYRSRLAGLPGVRMQDPGRSVRSSWTYLAVDFGSHREAVERRLAADGIQSRRYFRPLHEMPRFREIRRGRLPVTERLGDSLLCLPLFADLGDAGVDEVCAELRAAIEETA